MNSLDFLHYCLAVGFLLITIAFSFMAFQVAITIRALKTMVKELEDITHDVLQLKNGIKKGTLYAFMSFLQIISLILRRRK